MELHLASMENITCWAFRKLFQGATDSYTGVLSLNYILKKRSWKEADLFPIQGQRQWIQIATATEEECKRFIERLQREQNDNPEKYNVYGVQLNCSCPSYNLIKLGHGPALISKSQKVSSLLRELLKQNKFKVGIKVRLGLTQEEVKQGRIFQLLSELEKIKGLAHVAIHFKHAKEPSYTPYDYSLMKRISQYNLSIIINGGINSYKDFLRITKDANKKNIIGFMMARQALKEANCFIESSRILNKTNFSEKSDEQIKKEFEDNCKLHLPKEIYIKTIKKYCSWAKDLNIEFPKSL
jgi:tRNA-dihydrouridine synthase